MKKPTAAQMKVLEAMQGGTTLTKWWGASGGSWFELGWRTQRDATINAIVREGWVAPEDGHLGRKRQPYLLTDSGIAALKARGL